jgi:hypothetical protein
MPSSYRSGWALLRLFSAKSQWGHPRAQSAILLIELRRLRVAPSRQDGSGTRWTLYPHLDHWGNCFSNRDGDSLEVLYEGRKQALGNGEVNREFLL